MYYDLLFCPTISFVGDPPYARCLNLVTCRTAVPRLEVPLVNVGQHWLNDGIRGRVQILEPDPGKYTRCMAEISQVLKRN